MLILSCHSFNNLSVSLSLVLLAKRLPRLLQFEMNSNTFHRLSIPTFTSLWAQVQGITNQQLPVAQIYLPNRALFV